MSGCCGGGGSYSVTCYSSSKGCKRPVCCSPMQCCSPCCMPVQSCCMPVQSCCMPMSMPCCYTITSNNNGGCCGGNNGGGCCGGGN